ncbi:unnamed protein product [Lota lota]
MSLVNEQFTGDRSGIPDLFKFLIDPASFPCCDDAAASGHPQSRHEQEHPLGCGLIARHIFIDATLTANQRLQFPHEACLAAHAYGTSSRRVLRLVE